MFDNLMVGHKSFPNNATNVVAVGTGNNLFSSLCQIGDVIYQYGGKNASYGNNNGLRSFNPSLSPSAWTELPEFVMGAVCCNPKLLNWGGKLVIAGITETTNLLMVKVVNLTTKEIKTYTTTATGVGSGLTSAAIDGDTIYFRISGTANLMTMNLNTGVNSVFATLPEGAAVCEGMLLDQGRLYLMGGWFNNNNNVNVYAVDTSARNVTLWDTLPSTERGTVNQGIASVGDTFHYLTWTGGPGLIYQSYCPRMRMVSETQYQTTVGYRNAGYLGTTKTGLMFGGGTSIPVGGANWTTAGRLNQNWRITIPNSGFDLL